MLSYGQVGGYPEVCLGAILIVRIVVVELVFGWGSAFNSTNPYLYYNNQEYTATLGSDAFTKLDAINEALSTEGLKYTVTFTCK